MAILAAAAAGAIIGKAASGYVFNYTKSLYETRIAELERLIGRLKEHLVQLESYRDEMPQFWNDENARKTALALDETILSVKRAMGTAEGLARALKGTVDSLGGSNSALQNSIEDALNFLKANNS